MLNFSTFKATQFPFGESQATHLNVRTWPSTSASRWCITRACPLRCDVTGVLKPSKTWGYITRKEDALQTSRAHHAARCYLISAHPILCVEMHTIRVANLLNCFVLYCSTSYSSQPNNMNIVYIPRQMGTYYCICAVHI